MPRTTAIVGCGLIGGSLLRALSWVIPADSLLAVDVDPTTRERISQELGLRTADALPRLEDALVVLATPLPVVLDLLRTIGPRLGAGSVVTDVAGLKLPVLEAEAALPSALRFVGGHPMAGREVGGFAASDPELFRDRRIALCPAPGADERAVDEVAAMWRSVGGVPLVCEAGAHDAAVARISHLPFIVAAALAGTLGDADELARSLAAGGARDTTRVAEDASIRPVAQANPTLAPLVREVGEKLLAWADSLEHGRALDGEWQAAAQARRKLFSR